MKKIDSKIKQLIFQNSNYQKTIQYLETKLRAGTRKNIELTNTINKMKREQL